MSKVILPTDPEALKEVREAVNVYVSRNGKFYLDEEVARLDGATHQQCKCGNGIKEKFHLYCPSCKSEKLKEKRAEFLKKPARIYAGEPVYDSETHQYFMNDEDLIDHCIEAECLPSNMFLVYAVKTSLPGIDVDYWCDNVHEDYSFSTEFNAKLKEFNEYLATVDTQTWECPPASVQIRADVSHLDEMVKVEIRLNLDDIEP